MRPSVTSVLSVLIKIKPTFTVMLKEKKKKKSRLVYFPAICVEVEMKLLSCIACMGRSVPVCHGI